MKRENIDLSLAELENTPTIFEIHSASISYFCRGHYKDSQIAGWFQGRSAADYVGAIQHKGLWLARHEGYIVGFVEFWSKSVSMLYLLPSYAGVGIGTIMLKFALETMLNGGASSIEIESLTNAQAFYERFGFAKVGENRIVRPSGLEIETVRMKRAETRQSTRLN